ncbi:hypothetical protein DID88_009465 [Monilinia fructigena]|uniref:Uncharacterized protein n=1 Tax=Monilinia fructigena TaxID=38457 RepID=A0A395ISJ5_9HELO|nr:hypothetical protein DID88_009465 [Monilinia fructigena]
MLPRYRSSLFFAIGALLFLWVLLRNHERIVSHVVEQYRGTEEKVPSMEEAPTIQVIDPLIIDLSKPQDSLFPPPQQSLVTKVTLIESTAVTSRITLHFAIQTPEATSESYLATSTSTATWNLKNEFMEENVLLGQEPSAGQIYGNTLDGVIEVGQHTQAHTLALKETDIRKPYSQVKPFEYNPYPDYNDEHWKSRNKGKYVPCNEPNRLSKNLLAFSGHSEVFEEPQMGSFSLFGIDNNLCFERETRLSSYGYVEDFGVLNDPVSPPEKLSEQLNVQEIVQWDDINWGSLQTQCLGRNINRYLISEAPAGIIEDIINTISNASTAWNNPKTNQANTKKRVLGAILNRDNGSTKELKDHLLKVHLAKAAEVALDENIPFKSRTAIMLRSYSGGKWNENDKQNVRSLITELALRSGGEYEVFLLVHIRNSTINIENDEDYIKALHENVPKEFHDIAVLWNEAYVQGFYPNIPKKLPMYTNLNGFLFKYLHSITPTLTFIGIGKWILDIPAIITTFLRDSQSLQRINQEIEILSGKDTIWAPPKVADVVPTGPSPPVPDQIPRQLRMGRG